MAGDERYYLTLTMTFPPAGGEVTEEFMTKGVLQIPMARSVQAQLFGLWKEYLKAVMVAQSLAQPLEH